MAFVLKIQSSILFRQLRALEMFFLCDALVADMESWV